MRLKSVNLFGVLFLSLFLGIFMTACGGGGTSGGGSGTLTTLLTDSATAEYKAVYVTVASVEVHRSGGQWETVATPNKTYNLLELVNGVRETLGVDTLEAGHYTQMRIIMGDAPDGGLNILSTLHPFANYVIDPGDVVHELKVPSGTQTGLKIVNGFDISSGGTTELVLDFDASRSVVKAGASGKYLLKPTVKVLNTVEYAIVSGIVTDDAATPAALEGAFVTAQLIAPLAPDDKDKVVVEAGTISNATGHYKLFLEPLTYNMVAAMDGYLPECAEITLASGDTPTVDFSLTPDALLPGTVTGTVTIAVIPHDQWATIEFRQSADCGAGATTITVKTVNVADGGTYSVDLPEGSYTAVVSSYSETTITAAITVTSDAVTTQDFEF